MFEKGVTRLQAHYRRRDSTVAGQLQSERMASEDAARRAADCLQRDQALEQKIVALWENAGHRLTLAAVYDCKRLESRLITQRLTLGIEHDNAVLERDEHLHTIERLQAQRRHDAHRLRKLEHVANRMRVQRHRITNAHAERARQEVIDAKAFERTRHADRQG